MKDHTTLGGCILFYTLFPLLVALFLYFVRPGLVGGVLGVVGIFFIVGIIRALTTERGQ